MRLALLVGSLLFVPLPDEIGFRLTTVDAKCSPRRLAAAALDADHQVDLFVVGSGPGNIPTLQVLHNAAGHFIPGWNTTYALPPGGPFDVDLADTDSDGDNDVVFVVTIGHPGQRFNDGHGNFDGIGSVPTASVRFENELVDMNGNGTIDLVYYEPDFFFDTYFGTQIGIGNGTFSFLPNNEIQLSADLESHRRIALGDITGDGLIDGAFTSVITGGIRFFEGKPPPAVGGLAGTMPGWKQPLLVYAPPCNDAVMADLDRDGRLDLIASAKTLDSVVVFLTGPTGEIGQPHLFAAGDAPDAIAAADFDLDGVPDVIVTNPANLSVQVLRGTGLGGLEAPLRLRVGLSPSDVATADLDNDGDIDAAVACADHVAVLFNRALSPDLETHFTQK